MKSLFTVFVLITLTKAFTINSIYSAPDAHCSMPSNILAQLTHDGGLELSWDAQENVSHYLIRSEIAGSEDKKEFKLRANRFFTPKLLNCTAYEVKVISVCAKDIDKYESDLINFTTNGCISCGIPQNISSDLLEPNSVILSWDPVPGATEYIIEGKDNSGDEKLHFFSVENYISATSLNPNTSYKWKVRTICGNQQSSQSETQKSVTSSVGNVTSRSACDKFEIYSSPLNGMLNFHLDVDKRMTASYKIIDISGKIHAYGIAEIDPSGSVFQFDISEYQSGIYLVLLELENRILTARFTVHK